MNAYLTSWVAIKALPDKQTALKHGALFTIQKTVKQAADKFSDIVYSMPDLEGYEIQIGEPRMIGSDERSEINEQN